MSSEWRGTNKKIQCHVLQKWYNYPLVLPKKGIFSICNWFQFCVVLASRSVKQLNKLVWPITGKQCMWSEQMGRNKWVIKSIVLGHFLLYCIKFHTNTKFHTQRNNRRVWTNLWLTVLLVVSPIGRGWPPSHREVVATTRPLGPRRPHQVPAMTVTLDQEMRKHHMVYCRLLRATVVYGIYGRSADGPWIFSLRNIRYSANCRLWNIQKNRGTVTYY